MYAFIIYFIYNCKYKVPAGVPISQKYGILDFENFCLFYI